MSLKFGTDGVRGVANAALTPSYVLNLGRAAARVLGADRVVIGRDTRRSGAMLESALAAGFASEGVDVELLGVVPTPAVAYIAKVDSVAAAVITASHNPFADNGVKLFAAGGVKLTDEIERGIEAELAALDEPVLTGGAVGTISHLSDGLPRYVDHLVGLLPAAAFSGMSLVLDCAHGAMSPVAPDVLRRLGADVHLIGVEPDGCNINDGFGATHPGPLAAEVVARRAQLGLAFDGDGDRLIAVDHRGEIVDGDRLIALLAVDLRSRDGLAGNTVVVTVMSNLGFHKAMAHAGIDVLTTAVGDRYVLEGLAGGGFSLGGEQSGHIIVSDLATTGDGLLAGLLVVDLTRRSGRTLADLADGVMRSYPQVLLNTRVSRPWTEIAPMVATDLAAVEDELNGDGRVLVRPSGTEPLVRVMIEASTDDLARALAQRLVTAITAASG